MQTSALGGCWGVVAQCAAQLGDNQQPCWEGTVCTPQLCFPGACRTPADRACLPGLLPSRYAGVLLGLSNTAGVLAGVLGTAATGFILQNGSWNQVGAGAGSTGGRASVWGQCGAGGWCATLPSCAPTTRPSCR